MKNLCNEVMRPFYDEPCIEVIVAGKEDVLCQSGSTQTFQDAGLVEWFN